MCCFLLLSGLGPNCELKYPAHPLDKRWNFPGVGEFQVRVGRAKEGVGEFQVCVGRAKGAVRDCSAAAQVCKRLARHLLSRPGARC